MKNYFFINPAAGQGEGIKLKDEILKVAEAEGFDCEIIFSESVHDAEVKSKSTAESLNGAEARFFACGGDGTVNEVLNGMYGHPNIALGVVPVGTGNDTVRNFPYAGDFRSISAQLNGEEQIIDVMKYSGEIEGKEETRYCINMFNIGFDCNVVELMSRLKTKPLISGSMAYLLAIFFMILKKKGTSLRIESEGQLIKEGEMLLCTISNGSYCGGGIKSCPQSLMNDGIIDLGIVDDVTRTEFLRLFPKYQKGTHLDAKGIEKILTVKSMRNLKLSPYKQDDFIICVDGEIVTVKSIDISVIDDSLRFILPRK